MKQLLFTFLFAMLVSVGMSADLIDIGVTDQVDAITSIDVPIDYQLEAVDSATINLELRQSQTQAINTYTTNTLDAEAMIFAVVSDVGKFSYLSSILNVNKYKQYQSGLHSKQISTEGENANPKDPGRCLLGRQAVNKRLNTSGHIRLTYSNYV